MASTDTGLRFGFVIYITPAFAAIVYEQGRKPEKTSILRPFSIEATVRDLIASEAAARAFSWRPLLDLDRERVGRLRRNYCEA